MTGSSVRDACAFCGSRSLAPIVDFGDVALAGGFLKPAQFETEPRYRLRVVFCTDCLALQLTDVVDPAMLFANYFYFSSAIRTLREHFVDYASEVVARFLDPQHATVVEIGCNDGVLLKPLADQGVRTPIGVDPATNIVQAIDDPRITVVNDFFGSAVGGAASATSTAPPTWSSPTTSTRTSPTSTASPRASPSCSHDDGVFVFEVHYLGKSDAGPAVRHDLPRAPLLLLAARAGEPSCVGMAWWCSTSSRIPIHGGSMRYYVCRTGSRWAKTRDQPRRAPAAATSSRRASTASRRSSASLREIAPAQGHLDEVPRSGCAKARKRVAGYGASGRANTIIQYCGIGTRALEYMIDDAPAKWGYYTPGSHFEIRSDEVLQQRRRPTTC